MGAGYHARVGRRGALALAGATAFGAAPPRSAPAQPAAAAWRPERPVTLVLPFSAGAGSDAIARLLASAIEPALGQRVLVDNRPGGNGTIAAVHVARAAPDGHTLFVTTNTTHAANPALMRRLEYDPVADFTPVSRLGTFTFMLVVGEHVPATTLRELLDLARARPGQLTYASGNSTGIVGGATIAAMAGVQMTHVPYRSTPPALTDVLAGRVTCMVVDMISGLPHARAGRLRALAVTTAERSPRLPEAPTIHEAGLPGYDITSWAALFGPARLPAPAVAALNAAVRGAWTTPELRARCAEMGFEVVAGPPEELDTQVRRDLRRWGEMARAAGIEPE